LNADSTDFSVNTAVYWRICSVWPSTCNIGNTTYATATAWY